ncbi:MAG TPA: hypothetical protein VHS81_05185 [Caulobacteraceae bacterium]|nr:hypothetical protein [Caulobacteraceae bacterium]
MADNQLVDLIENILLSPSSDFYISNILHDPAGNALDPRTIDRVDLGVFQVEGIQIGIVIKNLVVKGLSNVQVAFDGQGNPKITVDGDTVTFHAILPNRQDGYTRPADVPEPAHADGDLDVSIGGQPMPPGTLALTISAIKDLTGVFDATEGGGGLSTVNVDFKRVSLGIDVGTSALVVKVKLPTIFNETINYVLNQADTQAKFLEQVNAKLSSPDILSTLSQVATEKARAALANAA